jgi:hypothetical protein
VGAEIAKLTPQIQKATTDVAENRRQTAQERMYSHLDSNIEDWRNINISEPFLSWLANTESYTGATRMDLLRSAFSSGHGDRVVAIFKGYLAETAPPSPAVPPQTRRPGRASLADLAAPGQTRTAGRGPTEIAQPKPVTRADIQTFYSDVARGVYKNRPEDQAKGEAVINAAVTRGAVI